MSDPLAGVEVMDYATAARLSSAGRQTSRERRQAIETEAGGLAEFQASLSTALVDHDDAEGLQAFYHVLERGILADELVPLDDFKTILSGQTDDPLITAALGRSRYFCIALRDRSGKTIGAAGSILFMHHSGVPTLHSSYGALLPEYRGLGLAERLMTEIMAQALAFAAASGRSASPAGGTALLHFIETNWLPKMTLRERLLDEAMAMHPLERDRLWEGQEFRRIASIAYHQRAVPPIPLALKVRAYRPDAKGELKPQALLQIPAETVLSHVRAFDSILLNFDSARLKLQLGYDLPDPRDEGLLASFAEQDMLDVEPLATAVAERALWFELDKRIALLSEPDLDASMEDLAGTLAIQSAHF